MVTDPAIDNERVFEELQELVALEVKDILATATEEGYAAHDVVSALEAALRAEIDALAKAAPPLPADPGAPSLAEPLPAESDKGTPAEGVLTTAMAVPRP